MTVAIAQSTILYRVNYLSNTFTDVFQALITQCIGIFGFFTFCVSHYQNFAWKKSAVKEIFYEDQGEQPSDSEQDLDRDRGKSFLED